MAALTAIKGIGPWTAELYLLFCASHPDIFPSGDLALQKAVAHALKLETRPVGKALDAIASAWAPNRAAAALLFWRYYRALGMNSGILL
jgi:DNA-3-methyladenine glycosylase II